MWIRRTRLTLAIALLLSIVILSWLAGHPRIYSGHIGRLVTRHVLSDLGLSFACRDIAGNPLRALRFYDVVMTRDGRAEDFAYLSCDSLDVRYELNSFFSNHIIINELVLHGPRLSVRHVGTAPAERLELPSRTKASVALRLDIQQLRIQHGEVDVQTPGFAEQQNFRGIQLESSLALAGDDLRLNLDEFALRWIEGPYEELRLTGVLEKSRRRVELKDANVWLDSLVVGASAEATLGSGSGGMPPWRAELVAKDLDLGRMLAAVGKPLPIPFRLDASATLQYEDSSLAIDGRGVGQLAHYDFDFQQAKLRIADGDLEFERAVGTWLGTGVNGGGRLDTQAKLLQLSGRVENFDLSRPWKEGETSWPASDIDADFQLELALDESHELAIEIRNGRGEFASLAVDSLRARLQIDPVRGLVIERATGRCNRSQVQIAGTLGARGEADLDIVAESRDAAPWLAERLPDWQARMVSATGHLSGQGDSLALAVRGGIADVRSPRLSGRGITADLQWRDLRDPESLSGDLQVDELVLQEWLLGNARASFDKRGERIRVDRLFVEQGDSSLTATGRFRLGDASHGLELDSLRVHLGELVWWLPEPSRLEVGPGLIRTDGLRLQGERGSLQLSGAADLDGALDLHLALEQTDLSLLRWAQLVRFECGGVLDGQLSLGGHADAPLLDLELAVRDAQLREQRADSLRIVMHGDGASLSLSELDLSDQRGRLRGAARANFVDSRWLTHFFERPGSFADHWPSAQLEATFSAQDLDIDAWLPVDREEGQSYGRLRARLDVFGQARRPEISGEVAIAELRNSAVTIPQLSARVEADSLGVRLEDGSIGAEWLEFDGSWPLLLSASEKPRQLDDTGLRLVLRSPGEMDLAPLARLFPAIEAVQGRGSFEFVAIGDPRDPRLSGRIALQGDRLRLRDLSEEFREIHVEGTFHDGLLDVTRAQAREGEKGRVDGTAQVIFAGLKPEDIRASVQLHRILLLSVPELRAIVSSQGPVILTLRSPSPGGPRVPHFSGQLVIDRARYNGEFTGGAGGGSGVLQATSTPPWIADLRISLRDQIRISNSVAELLIHGDVDLTRDLSGLRLRGVAEIASGRVSVARLLDFEITEGRLDFSRGANLEPIIEITAETDVPVYSNQGRELEHVTVRVTGTFATPQLAFSSQSGYDEKTIINLLAGIPIDQGAEGVGLSNLAVRMAGKELTGALADAIGVVDTIDLDTNESGDPEGTTRVGVGKYLDVADKPLYLRYSQGLSVSERDIYLEYQLRRRFLLTFEVRRRLRESVAHTELNADLKFRVEY